MSDIIVDYNPYSFPACNKCQHLNRGTFSCKAFPERIPNEILDGDNDHTKPLPNQGNDLVFTPKKKRSVLSREEE